MLGHRHREHERVGVDAAGGEMQQSAEGDGQHEDVDEQEIQRKQPHGFLQMTLVDVLDHEHLELARQHDDGEHGEQGERDPADVAGAGIRS